MYPTYKYDERLKVDIEVDKPNENVFMPVGYNLKKPNDGELGNKHYRRFYPKELESIVTANGDKLVVSPFLTETITKCQQKKKKSGFLGKLFGAKSGDPEEDSE